MLLYLQAAQKLQPMQLEPALKYPPIFFSSYPLHPLHPSPPSPPSSLLFYPSPSIYPMDGEVPPLQEGAL